MRRAVSLLSLTCLAALVATSAPAEASELRGVMRNNRGVQNFGEKKPVEAFDRFTESLADLPFRPEVHYNLGTSFLANKEVDKALSQFQEAVRLAPGDSLREGAVRFRAYFNAGVALTELKRIDEALEMYQRALNEVPDSIEAKTNIELLVQSQAGGGGGEDEKDQENQQDKGNQKDSKPKEGQDQDKSKPDQPQQFQNQPKEKPTPRPFKSDQLSQQDVNRILEELKRQEEQIRARMQQQQGGKDAPPDKDW
jgi:Ca-activated chloride channel homolog